MRGELSLSNFITLPVTVGHSLKIGRLCCIGPNVVIGNNVTVGNYVVLKPGTVIEDGCQIDDGVISSPNHLHDAHCRWALRSGADVICEKPLGLHTANLDWLGEIEDTRPLLEICENIRMVPR